MAAETNRREAFQLYEQSLDLFQTPGDDWMSSNVSRELGRVAMYLGEYEKSVQLLEQCLKIRQDLGDQ